MPGTGIMENNTDPPTSMKDKGDSVQDGIEINGTDCNGETEDNDDINTNSLQDKLKGKVDGFGIVSHNGHGDHVNGVENGDSVGSERADDQMDVEDGDKSPKEEHIGDGVSGKEMEPEDERNVEEMEQDSCDSIKTSVKDEEEVASKDTDDIPSKGDEHERDEALSKSEAKDEDKNEISPSQNTEQDKDESSPSQSAEQGKDQALSPDKTGCDEENTQSGDNAEKAQSGDNAEGTPKDPSDDAKVKATSQGDGAPAIKETIKPQENDTMKSEKKKKLTKVDRLLANDRSSSKGASENLRPYARLLFDIGLDLVRKDVYKDLVKVQKKKKKRNKLSDGDKEQLDRLGVAYDHLVEKNQPFALTVKKCARCDFRTDSVNSLEFHKEYEHNGACSMCDFTSNNMASFYFHMEAEHNRYGRVHPIMGIFSCPYCTYEQHNAKQRLSKHLQRCEKSFDLRKNLQPVPNDCDIPLTPSISQLHKTAVARPVQPVQSNPVVHGKSLRPVGTVGQMSVPKSLPPAGLQHAGLTPQLLKSGVPPFLNVTENQGPQLVQIGAQYFLVVNQNGQTFMTPMAMSGPNQGGIPTVTPSMQPASSQAAQPAQPAQPARPAKEAPPVAKTKDSAGNFEICEICGGFVKDRGALRIHFYWAHKIEIHPSVMKERFPALKCHMCELRFWTYQGYKRHCEISHPNAKKREGGMTCYVCAAFVPDFITHMTSKHPQVVKHMLTQMRCVVCQDAFPTETALESHMLVDHKDVVTLYGSLVTMKKSPIVKPNQDAAVSSSSSTTTQNKKSPTKCSRCSFVFSTSASYRAHFLDAHCKDKESCLVCSEEVLVGKSFIEHVTKNHLRKVTIPIIRLSEAALVDSCATNSKKRKRSEEIIVIDLDHSRESKKVRIDTKEDMDDVKKSKDGPSKKEKDCDEKGSFEEVLEVDGEQIIVQKVDD